MSSIDILFEFGCASDQLREAVAAALGVSSGDVRVIYDLSEYPKTVPGQVVCNVQYFSEGFRQGVTICCNVDIDEREFAHRMAWASKMRCLIPANVPNPYAMKLVLPNGEVSDVYVDVSALDEGDAYVLE